RVDAPARWYAGRVLGLHGELGEVDLVVDLGLGGLESVLQLRDALFEQQDPRLRFIRTAGPRDLRVAELSLERREQVEGIAAPVGAGDLPLLLPEEHGEFRHVVRIAPPALGDEVGRPYVDQVREINISEPGTQGVDVLTPVIIVEGVLGDGLEALAIA